MPVMAYIQVQVRFCLWRVSFPGLKQGVAAIHRVQGQLSWSTFQALYQVKNTVLGFIGTQEMHISSLQR